MQAIIAGIIGVLISGSGLYFFTDRPEPTFGAVTPLRSSQLASGAANGECLTTDGTQNAWSACSGEGVGDGTWSTTSASYFSSLGLAFSTTSNDYWKTVRNFFSTTSADYWETQQTARTADDLTNNSIEDLNDVAAMTENLGDLLYWNGTTWTDIATSSLNVNLSNTVGTLTVSRGGTGQTTFTASQLLYGNGTNALSSVATTSLTATTPLTLSQPISVIGSSASALAIADAIADGSTKGAAAFTAADFNSASGVISLDYTNGTAASASNKGFLTSADWSLFNNKISSTSLDACSELLGLIADEVTSFCSTSADFTFASTFGAVNAATSSNLWAQGIFNASSTVTFGAAGQNFLRWDAPSGELGIGTTTPWATLSISNNTFGAMPAFAVGSTTNDASFIINNAGRVGVGTSSISARFGMTIATSTMFIGTQYAGNIASSSAVASSYTVNWNTGNTQRFMLNQATTFIINATSSNPLDGATYRIKICQDAVGSRTATFATPGQLRWWNGTTTISSAANTCTWIGMIYDGLYQRYDVVASSTGILKF